MVSVVGQAHRPVAVVQHGVSEADALRGTAEQGMQAIGAAAWLDAEVQAGAAVGIDGEGACARPQQAHQHLGMPVSMDVVCV